MADPEGGGILEELAKLVESALFPEGMAPALAPEPAALPAVAGMPSVAVRPLHCATCSGTHCILAALKSAGRMHHVVAKADAPDLDAGTLLGLG